MPATVGVVVTTCEVTDRLAGLLTALCAQTVRPLEVLVVDNRPAVSGVRSAVRRLGAGPVRYVAEPARGLSRARNAGLRHSTTDIVAFTDDDVDVTPGWLAAL